MQKEELKGDNEINIAAILSQSSVEAIYSGGAIISKDKANDVIEGVIGNGDDFMLGKNKKDNLPTNLLDKLKILMNNIREYYSILGNVSIEWVFDGNEIWVVQLNQLENVGRGSVIVFGNPISYEKFFVIDGLEKLAYKIKEVKEKNMGIELIGDVGICSHFGDLLRQSNIPSFITRDNE